TDACVYGNSVYINSNGKIYKAKFTPPDRFEITYAREAPSCVEDGSIYSELLTHGLLIFERDGEKYVHRLWDDTDIDVTIFDEEFDRWWLVGIHRDTAVFVLSDQDLAYPLVQKIRDNAIVIELRDSHLVHFQENSPFIYVFDDKYIYTLNSDTWEFLAPLQIGDDLFSYTEEWR
ncbi:hypothetical protein PENTCL1PPCAC_8796, partial [Pristionchus entomophagus]